MLERPTLRDRARALLVRLATSVRRFKMLPTTAAILCAYLWGLYTQAAISRSPWYWLGAVVALALLFWAAHRVDVWTGRLRWESRSDGYDDGYDQGFREGVDTVLHMVQTLEAKGGECP